MVSIPKVALGLYFYRLNDSAGGAERMICELANALAAREFAVHMITWDQVTAKPFYPLDPQVKWHRLGFRTGLADKLRRSFTLAKLLRKHGVRLLVGFVMSGDRTVFMASKLAATKLVAAERNAPLIYRIQYGMFARWLAFASLHLAERIVVQFADYIGGYPASLRSRIDVIPNPVRPVESCAYPDRPNARGRFTLLCVSRIDAPQKRLDKLVGAFARIFNDHPDWDLLIIGDGPHSTMLRQLGEERGLGDRFRLEQSRSNISSAYAEAHLFAIPSLWEGFPNALAEAFAHGLPAVGFEQAPGVAQLIEDGQTGWLVDGINDEVLLAECLNKAMSDHTERYRRGARARDSMIAFDAEKQFECWYVLLHTLLTEAKQ